MDMVRKRCRSSASFTITRSFAPARIELELLAKVFEVIEHGITVYNERIHGAASRPALIPVDEARYSSGEEMPDKSKGPRSVVRGAAA